jgi:hypothetical protein
MNSITSSYLKSVLVSTLILSAAFGTGYAINPAFLMVPQQNYTHQLYDERGDVSDPDIDIIEYGSYIDDTEIIIYLIVDGIISENSTFQLFIVAKTSANEGAHVYFNDFDIDAGTSIESNYDSVVIINNNTLSIRFPLSKIMPDSYMVGLEARALNFDDRDTTSSARNNTLQAKFLGIF